MEEVAKVVRQVLETEFLSLRGDSLDPYVKESGYTKRVHRHWAIPSLEPIEAFSAHIKQLTFGAC